MKSYQLIRSTDGTSITGRPVVAPLAHCSITARSTDRTAKLPQRPGLTGPQIGLPARANSRMNTSQPNHPGGYLPQRVYSPFQVALVLTTARQLDKPGLAAYVCYLNGEKVIDVERLHALRGHNPQINLDTVIGRVKRTPGVTGVILASWVSSTAEYPYAEEFDAEVERQHWLLSENGIKLVDNLRLSDTGVYSYYGDHGGPYSDSPAYHEKSICRLY